MDHRTTDTKDRPSGVCLPQMKDALRLMCTLMCTCGFLLLVDSASTLAQTVDLGNKSLPVDRASLETKLDEILKSSSNEDERHDTLEHLGTEFASHAPHEGWKLVLTRFTYLPDRQVFGMALLQRWARSAPEEALAACKDIPEGERRLLAYTAALKGWAKRQPEEAAKWVDANLTSIYRRTAAGVVGRIWAAEDPAPAAAWASTPTSELERIFILGEVLETWALKYGPDAAKWVERMEPGKMRDLMMSKVIFRWAENFPKTTAEWLVMNPDQSWLLPRVLAKWAKYDHMAASTWLQQVTHEELADQCKSAIASEWAQYNPRAAYEWVSAQLKGDTRQFAMNEVLHTWAQEYPREALSWVSEKIPQAERSEAVSTIVQTWSMTDTTLFSSWLDQQKPGLEKDLGLEQMARMIISTDPRNAMTTALAISNPLRRKEVSEQLIEEWRSIAPEEAAKWTAPEPSSAAKTQE